MAIGLYSQTINLTTQYRDKVNNANNNLQNQASVADSAATQNAVRFQKIDSGEIQPRPNEDGLFGYPGYSAALGVSQNRKLATESMAQIEINNANLAQQEKLAGQRIYQAGLKVSAASVFLGDYGIRVSSSPPFTPIPALSMQLEVDAERVAKQ